MAQKRMSIPQLHKTFLDALGSNVLQSSDLETKPLEVDLKPPLPTKIRLYIFNMTDPPGGRTLGELKIQLIIPGQARGERASFDDTGGRLVLLAGYKEDVDIFAFWDAGLYPNFSYSRNVQIYADAINAAIAGQVAERERNLRGVGKEIQIAVSSDNLKEGILIRKQRTIERIAGI